MFKLLRYYVAASLVAFLATAIVLIWFDRQVSMQSIVQLAERSNTYLAQLAMNPMQPALVDFLVTAADVQPGRASVPVPVEVARAIGTVMQDGRFIAKIRIYNPRGTVVFSTSLAEVGGDESRNKGFITAMHGNVDSQLVYRDAFNAFEGATEEDNLVHTYLPVRADAAGPVRGVFELYGDVNSMQQAEQSEVVLMAGALLILLALYAVQVLIVLRASNTIELQQRALNERAETLAFLAGQMIKTEESHKQKIAFELHEGVAQSLAALKMKAESGDHTHKGGAGGVVPADSMVPMLQEVIQEVRSIATGIRPPSLDGLGLLPTIYSLCRELEQQHAGVRIEPRISLAEGDVPAPLKGVLYRVILSAVAEMAQRETTEKVELILELDDEGLILLIDEISTERGGAGAATETGTEAQLHARFGRMEELATLSGGALTMTQRADRGATLRARWRRQ